MMAGNPATALQRLGSLALRMLFDAPYKSLGTLVGVVISVFLMAQQASILIGILGRVTSGEGGPIILDRAREVLAVEFPETSRRITLHLPDEKNRRVGQSIAAASLPQVRRGKGR